MRIALHSNKKLFEAMSSNAAIVLTQVLHFSLSVGLEMPGLLGLSDLDDWFDLTEAFHVHDMVLDLLSLVDNSVRLILAPHFV